MNESKLLAAAEEYLQLGYSVIPVGKDKKPLVKWGKYQHTAPDMTEVVNWAQQFPDMQLGIVTGAVSGIVVIDIEAGGDSSPYPETLTAKTGGDGLHLYYQHPGDTVSNGVRVAELVDIRGDGGFVVAPPSSSTKGDYQWMSDPKATKLTLYPGEITESVPAGGSIDLIPVGKRNAEAAKKTGELLAQYPEVEQRMEAWNQLQEWNRLMLVEPLDIEELDKVFTSISSKHYSKQPSDSLVLKPFTLKELYEEEFPPIKWLAKDLLPVGMMGAITGESNSYKSFLTLALAQSVATGTPFLGHFEIGQSGKVLIIDEENNRRIIEKRFKDMGVEAHENIIFLSQSGIQLDHRTHLESLKQVIDRIDPTLVVLDSLVRFHGKDENSASEMRQVMKAIGSLVSEDRSIIFIHHHKKEGVGKNSGSNSVRGSTDIFNALDCHIGVKRNTESLTIKQHKLRVQQELAAFTVGVDILGQHLKFVYGGEDTSRQDLVEDIKSEIKTYLYQAAGEEVSRKELFEEMNVSRAIITEALKLLEEADEIQRRNGARGMHLYSIDTTTPEPAETVDPEKIPF